MIKKEDTYFQLGLIFKKKGEKVEDGDFVQLNKLKILTEIKLPLNKNSHKWNCYKLLIKYGI